MSYHGSQAEQARAKAEADKARRVVLGCRGLGVWGFRGLGEYTLGVMRFGGVGGGVRGLWGSVFRLQGFGALQG